MAPITYVVMIIVVLFASIFHSLSIKFHPKRRGLVVLFLVAEAYLLVGVSMLLSFDTVHTDSEKIQVELGWPTRYIIQNQEQLDPPFPWNMRFQWESQMKIVIWKLLVNWLFFLSILYLFHPMFWKSSSQITRAESE